ncbi:MAG: nonstructural protein [Microviridae sp.]|nr:MAG: nonstructural protein [Microviridae sp.]
MTPFAANNDKDVMAGIAQAVNNLEENSAISKAPHHFEIWHLGEVTEDGHLVADKYLVADANSLIRPVGERQAMAGGAIKSQQSPPERTSGQGDAYPAAPPN